ncbi:protein yippee-like At5g53940 [Diospyros lotus]|uniref:protein yippee-like At5g53940 n=1 Tax=Diospyros lotus TaxID=55363 RepID=UPI002253084F|nr:protein yippee-like At5g53940 [Diospyros lotus]
MGRVFTVEVQGRPYRCRHCQTPLARVEDVISKSFNCGHGRAYLITNVVNISLGPEEERIMLTGKHTVCDIFCVSCGQILGWKYAAAHGKSQKLKEGNFVVERRRVLEEVTDDFNMDAWSTLSETGSTE